MSEKEIKKEENEEPEQNVQDKTEKKKRVSQKEKDMSFLNMSSMELLSRPETSLFKDILLSKTRAIKRQNMCNIDLVREEVESMNIDISLSLGEDTDIEIYNELIDIVQRCRDRMHAIVSKVNSDYYVVNEAYENLYKMWVGKFSRLSSDKKREGEAEFLLSFLSEKRTERSNFLYEVKNASRNLSDKMEALSRKVTIIQEVHKIIGLSVGKENISGASKELDKHRKKMRDNKLKIKKSGKEGKLDWSEVG